VSDAKCENAIKCLVHDQAWRDWLRYIVILVIAVAAVIYANDRTTDQAYDNHKVQCLIAAHVTDTPTSRDMRAVGCDPKLVR
jgi:hypothetical protein